MTEGNKTSIDTNLTNSVIPGISGKGRTLMVTEVTVKRPGTANVIVVDDDGIVITLVSLLPVTENTARYTLLPTLECPPGTISTSIGVVIEGR